MKKILTVLFLSAFCINVNAQGEKSVTCPSYITVYPEGQLPVSLGSDLTYESGVPGGPNGYTNTYPEVLQVKLDFIGCHRVYGPECVYERPVNAIYMGPNGPCYNIKGTSSCRQTSSTTMIYNK